MPIRPQEFILDSKNVFRVKQINLLSILFAGSSLMFAIVCSLMICFNLVFSVISIFLFYRCFCSFHICRNLKRFYFELLENEFPDIFDKLSDSYRLLAITEWWLMFSLNLNVIFHLMECTARAATPNSTITPPWTRYSIIFS